MVPFIDPTRWTCRAQLQQRIADRAAVLLIQTEGVRQTDMAGLSQVWDVRAAIDEREHSPEVIDMAKQELDYALYRALAVQVDPVGRPWLLRLTRKGLAT